MPPTTLDERQVAELSDGLKNALGELEKARAAMEKSNEKAGALVAEQESLGEKTDANAGRLDAIQKEIGTLGSQMVTLAEQNTRLAQVTHEQMKTLGTGTEDSDLAYVVNLSGHRIQGRHLPDGAGAIFQSKRQAQEIGMWLLATMARECDVRGRARAWIKNQGSGIRFLPNVPATLMQAIGSEWHEKMVGARKAMYANDPRGVQQALAGGTTPGSILVQPEFAATLTRNIEEHGKFRQNALIWPMGSDTVHIPRRDGGLTVYWEGEAVSATETDPDYTLLGMTARKMFAITKHSSEIDEDSVFVIAALLLMEYALAFASEEDRIGFNGDGSGGNNPGFAGFVGVLGAAAHATPATADANGVPHEVVGETGDDTTPETTEFTLRSMTGKVHTWARGNAKWYINRTVLADFAGISMGTAGGSVVAFRDAAPTTIMGYPVVEVEQMPVSPSSADTHVIALGDLRKSWVLGDRHTVDVETSEHVLFQSDQIMTRGKQRVSFLPLQANGMTILQLAS